MKKREREAKEDRLDHSDDGRYGRDAAPCASFEVTESALLMQHRPMTDAALVGARMSVESASTRDGAYAQWAPRATSGHARYVRSGAAGTKSGAWVVCCATLLMPWPAKAADWIGVARAVRPYASLAVTSDSNLLRNPDGQGDESDEYVTLEAGIEARLPISRQLLLIDGRIARNDYDRFEALDHTAADARLLWKWSLGKLWDGELGYGYDRKLRDLSNQLIAQRDMLDRHKLFGQANRWLTTRWQMGGEIDWTKVSSSDSPALDKDVIGYGLTLDYVSKANNRVGMEVTYATTRFDSSGTRDFYDVALGPTLNWSLSGKTRLLASGGYKARRHDHLSDSDYDGFVGNLTLKWQITGKTSIDAELWRDISSLDDEVADYAIVNGIRLEPTWRLSPKTSLSGLASYEHRDFLGSASNLTGLDVDQREDRVSTLGLSVAWQPRRNVSIDLSIGAESRDSTRELREYTYQYAQLALRIGF